MNYNNNNKRRKGEKKAKRLDGIPVPTATHAERLVAESQIKESPEPSYTFSLAFRLPHGDDDRVARASAGEVKPRPFSLHVLTSVSRRCTEKLGE